MLLVPSPGSARFRPDLMEVEALARALGGGSSMTARFSDATGRERVASSWRELRLASGVVVVAVTGARVVASEALFAFADAACACGADALVDVNEVYKRTHGGPAPARLLRACGLGRALRGQCRGCRAALGVSGVTAAVESPFAHVGAFAEEGARERLRRASGFEWREISSRR